MFNFLSQFFNEKKYFLSTVTVASYIPGRIRVYSSLIKGNHENAKSLEEYFSKFKELKSFSINEVTGSVLIEYDVDKLASNKELHEIEQCLRKKAGK
ncbi:MAG: HMA2 domain-containing protein [Succinivibrio sp.]